MYNAKWQKFFFDLALSPSGSTVHVSGAKSATAILILGYAGSTLEALKGLREIYSKLRPTWRIVCITAPRDSNAFQLQKMETLQYLADCSSVVVHCISNHGHASWLSFMKQNIQWIHQRLRAIIFDCGPTLCGASFEGVRVKAMYDTALSACIKLGMTLDASQRNAVREAVTDHWTWQTNEMIVHQVGIEPSVPTLCIGAEYDDLMPTTAVDNLANIIRCHAKNRPVHTVCIRGNHATLFDTNADEYEFNIVTFLNRVSFSA